MYCKLIVFCWAVACVIAAPAPTDVVPLEKQQPTVIPIVSQSEELESNGTYKFSYETGNGIKREETSYDKILPKAEGRSAASSNEGGESEESNEIHVQQGSYSYTAPDGTVISVRYIADENGFRPVGDHIPQAIVAAAALAGSPSEKSGRALNVADSVNSASAPVVAAAPTAAAAPVPAAAPKPDSTKEAQSPPESVSIEPKEAVSSTESVASTEAAKPTVKSEEASESSNEVSLSTTEVSSTTKASNEASTDASEGTTIAAEASIKAADATTEAASEAPVEPASTSADASTTEAASTASA